MSHSFLLTFASNLVFILNGFKLGIIMAASLCQLVCTSWRWKIIAGHLFTFARYQCCLVSFDIFIWRVIIQWQSDFRCASDAFVLHYSRFSHFTHNNREQSNYLLMEKNGSNEMRKITIFGHRYWLDGFFCALWIGRSNTSILIDNIGLLTKPFSINVIGAGNRFYNEIKWDRHYGEKLNFKTLAFELWKQPNW